jgi:dipeptidyl aminopeptidase/acylaminoacyl peptidase
MKSSFKRGFVILVAVFAIGLAQPLAPQGPGAAPRVLTAADYAQAEKFMAANVASLVLRSGVRPNWLPDERFWYRNALKDNASEFILVDPRRGRRGPAFDHAALAAALSKASGKTYDGGHLPFMAFEFSADGKTISFRADGRMWSYDLKAKICKAVEGGGAGAVSPIPPAGEGGRPGFGGMPEMLSPDGRFAAFIRNDNLWVREAATKAEKQLTTDGVKDFGYATDNAGWTRSDRPVLLWSPDSKKIATFQQDQRGVGEMYLVETRVGHPTLQAWKYPLPGDEVVTTIQRVVIHLDSPRVVRLKMPPDQHRSTSTDDIKSRGGIFEDVQWSPDGTRLVFVSTSRDHKREVLREANPETGEVRDVFEETADTFFESGGNWRYLAGSNEIIWFSEGDGWGQLYLYDLKTGALKNQITSGEGNASRILRLDETKRVVFFIGMGKEKDRDPYFRHLYRVGFDGRNAALLTPEDADHEVALSPSGRYFVDSFSKPDVPPVAVLRDERGTLILNLETADISPLLAFGWKPPIRFSVKARDGVTDIYGLMFRPTSFDPAKKYPIVNNIYPGPQSGSVGGRSFSPARGDTQALAELGFVVIQLDGMGTPNRSKKFHEAYYANMGDNTLPDQVAGMKQLAERYPWIDIDRAGIYGHSGGGYAACDAMFRYPDFFKVGVSQAGNHDNRGYEDDWGEKWQGLLVRKPDGTTNYDDQANQTHAKNLKGKLLLAHGTMDGNVPPYLTLLVVNELVRANKDFDLILFPNRSHGFGSEPYMVRRRWDYFVRYLLGAEPPKEYELKPVAGPPRR